MGSDVLMRPEDEDSDEFREYLKNLMKLQANRAKAGHAAPSSGSSDAYIAKLNRLKVERLALIKAGLPNAEIDTSYKPEDYKAAIFEAAEPLISGSILTGAAAIAQNPGVAPRSGRGQVRKLSEEEMETARIAEEKVQHALAKQAALGLGDGAAARGEPTGDGAGSMHPQLARLSSDGMGNMDNVLEQFLQPKPRAGGPQNPNQNPNLGADRAGPASMDRISYLAQAQAQGLDPLNTGPARGGGGGMAGQATDSAFSERVARAQGLNRAEEQRELLRQQQQQQQQGQGQGQRWQQRDDDGDNDDMSYTPSKGQQRRQRAGPGAGPVEDDDEAYNPLQDEAVDARNRLQQMVRFVPGREP